MDELDTSAVIPEVGEDQVAAEEIDGVVVYLVTEELGEDDLHNKQREQRVEHAPKHAEHCALVLGLEVARNEFFEEKLVFFHFLKHRTPRKLI